MKKLLTILSPMLILLGLQANVTLHTTSNISSNWNTGYVAEIVITNNSEEAISSWTANFALQAGQTINCLWNGTYTNNNQNFTITNQSGNGPLQPGQSLVLGFQVNNPSKTPATIETLTATGSLIALPRAGFGLSSSYKIDTVWATAFQLIVTLTNHTGIPTSSWTALFTLPQDFSVTAHVTNGIFTAVGQSVIVNNPWEAKPIPPDGSITISAIISMPATATPAIYNLQAAANISPAPIVDAPVLNPIKPITEQDFVVSWDTVPHATSYVLQRDLNKNFPNPIVITQGNTLSQAFFVQRYGTYFYRVAATNALGMSSYSNVQSVTIPFQVNLPTSDNIEHSAWYKTSWLEGAMSSLPKDVNVINLFVGELMIDADGKATAGKLGNLTLPQLDAFTAYCKVQEPPVAVKMSLRSNRRSWDLLSTENVQACAQGLVDFCQVHGLVGIDFDYEEYSSTEQEVLMGTLIKEFKALDPQLQTTLCINAGFGPTFPWQQVVKTILDAAMVQVGQCTLDRLYIKSYYDSLSTEQKWITGWAHWAKENYGLTPDRISVGIKDYDIHAYDPREFAAWANGMGFSTCHLAFDPAPPE